MGEPRSILFLTDAEVRQTLSPDEAIELARKGIQAEGAGEVAGNKFYMPVGENGFIKPFSGYLAGEALAFVKTFSFFPDNPTKVHLPATSSLVVLFDAHTGLPVCLMEANWVTGLKTGACTAVTAQALARSDSRSLAIFGAGTQGRAHLRALATCFELQQVWIFDIAPEIAGHFARELGPELDLPATPLPLADREDAVRQADMVITVTTGNQPLVKGGWLKPGAFLARLGSYQEVALEVITGADKLVVDRWQYVRLRIPELIQLA